jgi:hypothetical protein
MKFYSSIFMKIHEKKMKKESYFKRFVLNFRSEKLPIKRKIKIQIQNMKSCLLVFTNKNQIERKE